MKTAVFILGLLMPFSVYASTITYQFLIPSFGGNPNYFYVFKSEADVQNIYHAPEKPKPEVNDVQQQIEDFKRRLRYMILSRLASKIVDAAFGNTNELPTGTYEIEGFEVSIQPQDGEIQVQLTDTSTGSTTTVVVPTYKQ